MATCRTAAIAAGADPVDRREQICWKKGKWVLLVHGVSRWCHERFMVFHVRHRVFDVVHEWFMSFEVVHVRFMRFRAVSWAVS